MVITHYYVCCACADLPQCIMGQTCIMIDRDAPSLCSEAFKRPAATATCCLALFSHSSAHAGETGPRESEQAGLQMTFALADHLNVSSHFISLPFTGF